MQNISETETHIVDWDYFTKPQLSVTFLCPFNASGRLELTYSADREIYLQRTIVMPAVIRPTGERQVLNEYFILCLTCLCDAD